MSRSEVKVLIGRVFGEVSGAVKALDREDDE